jgi:hypothetical protein
MLRRKPRRKLFASAAGRRGWRVLLFAALFLLSGLLSWLVLAGKDRGAADIGSEAAQPRPRSDEPPKLYFHDFILGQPENALGEIYLWRSRTPRWDEEQVGRYWIPLQEITLEILARESDERIGELFAEVP